MLTREKAYECVHICITLHMLGLQGGGENIV